MAGLAFILGGPKGEKKEETSSSPSEGPPMSSKAEATKAVMRAIKMGDVEELEPALTAFVEACGYSKGE